MRIVFLCVTLCLLATVARSEPVAMICHLTGKAEVSGGAGGWTPARLLQKLEKGDQVRCLDGAEAGIVMVSGGKRFLLPAGQTARVGDKAIDGARPIAGLRAPSLEATNKLAGTRAGANAARPPLAAADLVIGFDGWLPASTRHLEWNPIKLFGVSLSSGQKLPAACTFSLYDPTGFLVWSARTTMASVDYPADLPPLTSQLPYVWRLDACDANGRPWKNGKIFWGILTFLDEKQARQLDTETIELKQQSAKDPNDPLPKILLAEKYRQFGVIMYSIDKLNELKKTSESSDSAIDDLYREAGRLALFLKGAAVPKQEDKEELQ